MTVNKRTVMDYMEGFRKTDHAMILSCLTDDICWEMPGFFQLHGKEAFDKEIENDLFEGSPDIDIIRLIEENNVVVAEGSVKSKFKDGRLLNAVFCDIFHMKNAKIKQLTSYLVNK